MDLIHLGAGNAAAIALMGYLVVFIGLILLMIVIVITGRIMMSRAGKKEETKAAPVSPSASAVHAAAEVSGSTDSGAETVTRAAQEEAAPAAQQVIFPGSAGQLALYDTDPREAAMVMAVLADTLGKPLSALRFKSIKEVK